MAKYVSLVTGGAGFIGSHVAEQLIKMGHKVVILDDLSGGFERNLPAKAIFIQGSVTDTVLLKEVFSKHKFDFVFHLAAYAAEGLSYFIKNFNYTNNLIGSVNLINLAVKHKIKRFIFTSSIAVYGAGQTPMTESMTPQPEDPYGISKYAVELDLKSAFKVWGLEYTIFRPHNVYGPKQNHGDPYRNVIGIFMNNIMQGKQVTIFGNGKQIRAFSYIDDVAPYIAKSCMLKNCVNQVIDIGADKPYSVLELAKIILKEMNSNLGIKYYPARKEVVNAYCKHAKAKKLLKIGKTTGLKEGIKKMVDWSKKIGPIESKKFKGIEVYENMPPSWTKLVA